MSTNSLYYLLVKTHNKTGLKYLCQTSRADYCNYTGSGTYWRRHVKEHGKDISTTIVFETTDKNKLRETGQHYSKLWNVSKSKEWANLCDEEGSGGITRPNGWHHTKQSKLKISKTKKKQKRRHSEAWRNAHSQKMKGRFIGENHPMYGKPAWNKGIPMSEDQKRNLSAKMKQKLSNPKNHPRYGKHWNQNWREAHSQKMKGKLAGEKHPNWKGGNSISYKRKLKMKSTRNR